MLRKIPHVAVVSPAIQKIATNGSVEILYGIDYSSFNALKPFKFLAGGPFEGPNDAIDRRSAGRQQNPATGKPYAVGDTITIMGHPFRVSGIVEQGKGGRKLIPIDTMAEMVDAEGKASIFYIKCDNPANDDLVMKEIRSTRGFENNTLTTVDSWLDQMTPSKIPAFNLALASGYRDCRDHRISGDLPIHVHGGAGAHARDRHSEVDGRVETDDCGRGAARVGGCWPRPA